MNMSQSDVVSDAEMRDLIRALSRSGKPFTQADVMHLVAWVTDIRIGEAFIQLALEGRKSLFVNEGEVYCDENHTPWEPEEEPTS